MSCGCVRMITTTRKGNKMDYTHTEKAKSKANYIAISYLKEELDTMITDPKEASAFQKEIDRLLSQQDKINQRARARNNN